MGYEKLRRELRSGVYALLTLKLLSEEGAMHGYGLRAKIRELSNGVLDPSEGTIYEMLKTLRKHGLIEAYWAFSETGRARKLYKITDKGRSVLSRIMGDVEVIKKVMEYLLRGDVE